MKNLELKISIDNVLEITKKLNSIKAKNFGILRQKDIYYDCATGRLKLREINNKKRQIIFYNRPNLKDLKISDYKIINIKHEHDELLQLLLDNACKEKIIVEKQRNLWIYKNTRIHLDKVKNLGQFLELETVIKKNNIIRAKNEYKTIFNLLNLNKFKKHSKSYSDLLNI